MLLSTDAEFGGAQRSALELAYEPAATRCAAFCAHSTVRGALAAIFDGLRVPVPEAVVTPAKGLTFYDDKLDYTTDPSSFIKRLGLDCVKSAGRARGIDFYDGVIDVEVYADNPNGADVVRVHEVDEMRQVAKMADAIYREAKAPPSANL